jgi:hypothetical protein
VAERFSHVDPPKEVSVNEKPRCEWTLDDLRERFGSVFTSDGAEWIRCVPIERIQAAGLAHLEEHDRLLAVPTLGEVE